MASKPRSILSLCVSRPVHIDALLIASAVFALVHVPVHAQPALPTIPEILVREGDVIDGIAVYSIDRVSINADGDWLATVNASGPGVPAVLRSGRLLFKAGDPLATGHGVIVSWGTANLAPDGSALWPITSSTGSGVYRTLRNTPPAVPACVMGTNAYTRTRWLTAPRVITLSANSGLILGTVDDLSIIGGEDAGIFAITLNDQGVQSAVQPLVRETNIISIGTPPTNYPFESLFLGPAQSDASSLTTYAWLGKLGLPTVSSNDDIAMLGPTGALLREGAASISPGRTYAPLSSATISVNAQGDWAMRVALSGLVTGNAAIVRNGAALVRKGEPFAAAPQFIVKELNAQGVPVHIDDFARVWWWCSYSVPDFAIDCAIVCNATIILNEGDRVGGTNEFIQTFRTTDSAFTVDPLGRHLLCVVTLVGGVDALVRVSPPAPPPGARCSPADIADDEGTPLPSFGVNNGVTEGDYNAFFASFFDALPACDIAADDATPLPPFGEPTAPNNGVTEADYNLFFSVFFDGC